MSGGVDSTVAAYLLAQRPELDVFGVYMQNWDEVEETGVCQSEAEFARVGRICDELGIECCKVNFVKQYWHDVFSRFVDMYEGGLTPNPDVLCNRFVKFGAFFEHATVELGADLIATGHYARVGPAPGCDDGDARPPFCGPVVPAGTTVLLRGADARKDQTYFLSGIEAAVLGRVLFPVGEMVKPEVKALAATIGLQSVAEQKESMGICFIGKRKFGPFLESYTEQRPPGKVMLLDGAGRVAKSLGDDHAGLRLLTIGQRASVGGQPERCFVAGKDLGADTLYVVHGGDHPKLFATEFVARDVSWALPPGLVPGPGGRLAVKVQVRHNSPAVQCELIVPDLSAPAGPRTLASIGWIPPADDGWHGDGRPKGIEPFSDEIKFVLRTPIRAVVPGQAVAIYDISDRLCLGGGIICDAV